MFSQACVILFTWWVSTSVHAGIPPPSSLGADTPRSRHPLKADTHPGQTPPQEQTPPPEQTPPRSRHPRADTPQEQTPPWEQTHSPPEQTPPPRSRHPPRHRACWEIRSTSGRYASYWNAILLPTCISWGSGDGNVATWI